MSVTDPIVRPFAGSAEVDALLRLGVQAFAPNAELEPTIARWRYFLENEPGFDPSRLRGAFRDATFLGGYLIYARRLRLADTWLPTTCIGGVVTDPAHRRQGVARALMADALAYARAQGHALLLLDGIPNFYARFGFADVFDVTWHYVRRSAAAAVPAPQPGEPAPYTVRSATPDDAPALLDLYHRHYGSQPGGFDRSLVFQTLQLTPRPPGTGPWLAVDAAGTPRGYLFVLKPPEHWRASEVAADDWPAAQALLRYQAGWFADSDDPPAELAWPLPARSTTALQFTDRLAYITDPDSGHSLDEWGVRRETRIATDSGWMARLGDTAGLLAALAPAWHARAAGWTGTLTLVVDELAFTLAFAPEGLTVAPAPQAAVDAGPGARAGVADPGTSALDAGPGARTLIRLSGAVLTPLLFGYQPLEWAFGRTGQHIPDDCVPLLERLFAGRPAWIAGSDAF